MGKRSAPIALFPERRRERERDKGKFSPNGLFVYCHLKQILYLRIITTVILFHVICSMSFGFIGFNGYIKQKLQCFHAGCTLDSVINNHFKPSWITLTFVMITPSVERFALWSIVFRQDSPTLWWEVHVLFPVFAAISWLLRSTLIHRRYV